MARTSWFAVFFWGLCISRLAVADGPSSVPPATPQQVRQTVEPEPKSLRSVTMWATGAAIQMCDCPCESCCNAVVEVADHCGTTVKRDLAPYALGHLLGEMIADAESHRSGVRVSCLTK